MVSCDKDLEQIHVASIPLKNIRQIGSSSQLLGKIKNVPSHQPDMAIIDGKRHEKQLVKLLGFLEVKVVFKTDLVTNDTKVRRIPATLRTPSTRA